MAETKRWKKCNECGKEFYTKDTKCPYCGSTSIKTSLNVGGGTIHPKGSLTATHEFRWSGTAWTILGIFLTLWATTFFGLCAMNNLPLWANLLISIVIMGLLFLVIYILRYKINSILDRVERKFTGKKKYHSN